MKFSLQPNPLVCIPKTQSSFHTQEASRYKGKKYLEDKERNIEAGAETEQGKVKFLIGEITIIIIIIKSYSST